MNANVFIYGALKLLARNYGVTSHWGARNWVSRYNITDSDSVMGYRLLLRFTDILDV